MLSKKDIVELNKELSNGVIINESSLDFAVTTSARSKNWLKTAAIFTRAILIDHVFEDGNKRTAAGVIIFLMEMNNISFDPEKIPRIIVKILKNNITNLMEIERCIKDAVR
jgi:prophage maintenance system killer protein